MSLPELGSLEDHGHEGDRPVMLRYPWVDVRAALNNLARMQPDIEAVQLAYINSETGSDAQSILGFSALMLRPGDTLHLPARSSATVFHVIEGGVSITAQAGCFVLGEADNCCIPGYLPTSLDNASATEPAFVFIADDAPLQKKLGVYEVRNT